MSAIITISDDLRKKLAAKAIEAAHRSNLFQSQRPVGAAVMARNGAIFQGAWYEQSQASPEHYAVRAALGNFLASGGEKVIAVAVYSPDGNNDPGDDCKRIVREFGSNIELIQVPVEEHSADTVQGNRGSNGRAA